MPDLACDCAVFLEVDVAGETFANGGQKSRGTGWPQGRCIGELPTLPSGLGI